MKLTRLIAAALAAACIFTLTSCKQEEAQTTANDYPVHVADTVVDHRPKKVVSLAPAITDTLFQLQMAGRVVAVSDYCDLPAQPGDPDYYNYPRAGTQQLPDIDAIKKLGADLVLMTAQPTDSVALELQQANIDFVVIAPAADLDGVRRNYVDLFRLLYGEETGASMAEQALVPFDHKLGGSAPAWTRPPAASPPPSIWPGSCCRWPPATASRDICSTSSAPGAGAPTTPATPTPRRRKWS